MGARVERARRALAVGRVARRSSLRRVLAEIVPTGLDELEHNFRSIANRNPAVIVGSLLLSSALLVRVVRFEWLGIAGFCLAAVLGLYMVWKIIRTPGKL